MLSVGAADSFGIRNLRSDRQLLSKTKGSGPNDRTLGDDGVSWADGHGLSSRGRSLP
jgi:hypothetical protein